MTLNRCMRSIALTRIVVVALALLSAPALAGPDRPYGGSCSAVVTPLTPPGVFPQELRIDLDCTLKHLGRTTGLILQTVTLDPDRPPGATLPILLAAEILYRAANGDTLLVSFDGRGEIDPVSGEVSFAGTETLDGGTGRFADATGSASLTGGASIFTNLGFYTTRGRISY